MVIINTKKIFALLAVVCSVYFVLNRSINLFDILSNDSLSKNISVIVAIISLSIFSFGNLLTFLNKKLNLRKLLFLVSAVLFVLVLVLSNINYNLPLNSPTHLIIIFGLFNVAIVYYFIDKNKINLAYIFVVVLLGIVFLMIGREAMNPINSNLSYTIGLIGTLLLTLISSWVEVKE